MKTLSSYAATVHPQRVAAWSDFGVEIVMADRERYRFSDMSGKPLVDVHLNGGTFNLGHRNPEIIDALIKATQTLDIGNHHFASPIRTQLAETLLQTWPKAFKKVVYVTGGSEGNDLAIKSARRATGRRPIVSIRNAYHGRTGLSGAAGDSASAEFFHSDHPDAFPTVPYDDLEALRNALSVHKPAAVLLEVIPATSGFPVASSDYHAGVAAICREHDCLLIADEVQTGLMRSGSMWACQTLGARPDILVTGKGLSGGMYPMAAVLLSETAASWLEEDGWAHVNTFGGSEIGCAVALKAMEIYNRSDTAATVARNAARLAEGLGVLRERHHFLAEVRKTGLIIGLKTPEPDGGITLMRACYRAGLWAIFAGFDRSVLQFKPGLLLTDDETDDILERLETALQSLDAVS